MTKRTTNKSSGVKNQGKAHKAPPSFWQKWFAGMMAVALVASAIAIVRHVQYNRRVDQERAQFMQVKEDLHTLAQQIAKEVGQPTESKEVQECNYASRDFGLGSLGCSVSLKQEFNHDFGEKINTIVASRLRVTLVDNSNNLLPSASVGTKYFGFMYRGLDCSINYSPPGTNDGMYSVDIYCVGNASAPYFPVTDGSDKLQNR